MADPYKITDVADVAGVSEAPRTAQPSSGMGRWRGHEGDVTESVYRVPDRDRPSTGNRYFPSSDRTGNRRALLWLVLVISAVCNVVTSSVGVTVFVGVGFGLLTLSCGAALVTGHYRNRRR